MILKNYNTPNDYNWRLIFSKIELSINTINIVFQIQIMDGKILFLNDTIILVATLLDF